MEVVCDCERGVGVSQLVMRFYIPIVRLQKQAQKHTCVYNERGGAVPKTRVELRTCFIEYPSTLTHFFSSFFFLFFFFDVFDDFKGY